MKRLFLILIAVSVTGCNLFVDTTELGPNECEVDCDVVSGACGDGLLEGSEKCDPGLPADSPAACPESCDDGVACTADTLTGSADTCDAVCVSTPIISCTNNDGCCPSDCNAGNDTDCDPNAVCGDGERTGAEECDPGIESGDGACPMGPADCGEPAACQRAIVVGASQNCDATCAFASINSCTNNDGCCAPGCDQTNDNDCSAQCGNGVTELGETCDGNCPSNCNDRNPCTTDTLIGTPGACDVACENSVITEPANGDSCCPPGADASQDDDCSATCGDNTVDANETCDGDCPTSCGDMDVCTTDLLIGSPDNCTAECTFNNITTCKLAADGCCPSGCNANNDGDCQPNCGNDVVEAGETCDGTCPASCDDMNACTSDALVGSPSSCDSRCPFAAITTCNDGDGCCPSGCNALSDDDCGASCGNNVQEPGETCDGNCPAVCDDGKACTTDLRSGTAGSCNVTCSTVDITSCTDNDGCCAPGCTSTNDNDCSASCGNGTVEGSELCDGNCPSPGSCEVCETFVGSPATCDARCVADSNCTACSLSGTCTCSLNQGCVAGTCQSFSGNCRESCFPDDYCQAQNGQGWRCSSTGDCIECVNTVDCPIPEHTCSLGICREASSCEDAQDPNQWCVSLASPNDTCQLFAGTCVTSCTADNDCGPTEECDNGVCQNASSCSQANDRTAWCAANVPGTNTCYQGNCYASCPTPGPAGACSCPDPLTQGCFQNGSLNLCEPQSRCAGICSSYRDQFCANNPGEGGCSAGGNSCVN